MKIRIPLFAPLLLAGLQFAVPASAAADAPVQRTAAGPFDIKVTPAGPATGNEGNSTGRMVIEKRYHGDLEGSGGGEMLTALTSTAGSAAYVAIERVNGTLHGRQGSFVVQHNGTRKGGVNTLSIAIVPDSGTGQLTGISGTMSIDIVEGKHFYKVQYQLPPQL